MGSDHVLCQRHKMLTTLFKQDYRRSPPPGHFNYSGFECNTNFLLKCNTLFSFKNKDLFFEGMTFLVQKQDCVSL